MVGTSRSNWVQNIGGRGGQGAFSRGEAMRAERKGRRATEGEARGLSLSLCWGHGTMVVRGRARQSGKPRACVFWRGCAKKNSLPPSGPLKQTRCPSSPPCPMTQPAPALFRLAGSVLRRLGGAVDAVGAGLQGRFASPEKGEAAFCAGSSAGSRAGGRRRQGNG